MYEQRLDNLLVKATDNTYAVRLLTHNCYDWVYGLHGEGGEQRAVLWCAGQSQFLCTVRGWCKGAGRLASC